MQETNVKICKSCGVIQERIQHGRFNSKDKRWRDPSGSMWSGLNCPSCHRLRMKEYRRDKKKAGEPNGDQE